METERKEIDSDPFVLVNSNEVDRDIAQAVGSRLGQQGIGYDIVERPEVFASYLATDEEHHGLMVIDGVCPPEWVQD
ncbi:MAG: hypothetical protein O3A00_29355, partial [Planctomycetota bacterium]|nr:hypothetical protein [Planctomycetota bacterium]